MELCRICKSNFAVYSWDNASIDLLLEIIYLKNIRIQENTLDSSFKCGIIRITHNAILKEVCMDKPRPVDCKEKALRKFGAFNAHPVTDALFQDNDFFDPRDLVQVKYEMLRKVHKEKEPIKHAAASFGFSRPSFYKTSANFEREGIAGLLPRKRGPRNGHKLTEEVLEFIEKISMSEKPMSIPALLDEVEKRFGIRVHRRTIERARHRREKKTSGVPEKKER